MDSDRESESDTSEDDGSERGDDDYGDEDEPKTLNEVAVPP